jgi:hypothetical protein
VTPAHSAKRGRRYRYYTCTNAQKRGWTRWGVAANAAPKPRPAGAAAATGKLSAPEAAALVLAEEGRPMGRQEMIQAMAATGWKSISVA